MTDSETPNEFDKDIEDFYSDDPIVGDMVFLKHKFEDVSIRGQLIGLERTFPTRGLSPDKSYEMLLYTGLRLKLGGVYDWFDMEDWEITDVLRGTEYHKLPPERVKPTIEGEDN